MRNLMSTACISLAMLFPAASLYAQTCNNYTEKNGLVIMEAENTPSALGKWERKTSVGGYKGRGHIEFTGNGSNGGPATSPISYRFKVTQSGVYRMILRGHKRLDGQPGDKNNDAYVRLDGDYTAAGSTEIGALKNNTKMFGGAASGWGWAEQLNLPGHEFRQAVYNLTAGNEYTFVMSGRSIKFNVDRIVFFKTNQYSLGNAKNTQNVAETCVTGGGNPTPTPVPGDTRASIPGKVQAEDYTKFFDTTGGNTGGQHRSDDVDIQATTDADGGFNVGWIDANEWLEFPINVKQAGEYQSDVRVASAPGNGMFTIEIDGVTKGNAFNVGTTGGWQTWETMSTSLGQLSAGDHTLRVQVQSGAFNLNWIELKRTGGGLDLDQCDTTQQCKNIFGNQATDCANSRSNMSICMCGTSRCDAP